MVPLGIGRVLLWYLSNVLNKVTPDERKKRPSQDVDAEKYGTRLRPLLLIQTPGFFEARTYRTVRTMFECEPCKIYLRSAERNSHNHDTHKQKKK